MTSLPYEDGKFDCVVCFHTIYHTDYSGMKNAISEIRRVLSDKGEAYITFNSKITEYVRKEKKVCRVHYYTHIRKK